MRVKNLFFGLLLTTTCLSTITSCSSREECLDSDSNSSAILLKSALNLQTRSTLQNTQIVEGQKVGVSITTAGDQSSFLYDNQVITADGSGAFNYTSMMYYPQSGENIDTYAYHPYKEDVKSSVNDSALFVVSEAQSVQSNYLNSDVLFAVTKDVKRSSNPVPLVFTHKLSKITYTIRKGEGVDISDLRSIILLNALPQIEMHLLDGGLSEAFGTPTDLEAFNIQKGVSSDNEITGAAVILPPQTLRGGAQLLKITIGDTTFNYTPTQNILLESGKNYNFIITIGMNGIIFESNITDWEHGGTIIGEGVIS